jgi:hypothetical protein
MWIAADEQSGRLLVLLATKGSLMAGPANLTELYAEAKEDVGEALATWVFRLAKARGRVVVAEKALAHLQGMDRDSHVAAMGAAYSDSLRTAVLETAPHPTQIGNAIDMLTEAVEWCTACETVLRLLETRPAAAAPLRTVQGGRR